MSGDFLVALLSRFCILHMTVPVPDHCLRPDRQDVMMVTIIDTPPTSSSALMRRMRRMLCCFKIVVERINLI